MAVSSKGRRKITVDGVEYVWWVEWARDHEGDALQVVGNTDDLHLLYTLGQARVAVLGRRLRGHAWSARGHRWFHCPAFGQRDKITPADVAALIRWAIAPGELPPALG